MTRLIALFIFLVVATLSHAAPGEKPISPEAKAVGEKFARELGVIADMVHREYVRPIPTNELYEAAIAAMYERAARPRPTTLLADMRRSKDETESIALVQQARAALHPSTSMSDQRDLMVAVDAFTKVLDPYSVLLPSAFLNGTELASMYGFDLDGDGTVSTDRFYLEQIKSDATLISQNLPSLPFRVVAVRPGSPAQQAGIRPGDMIRRVNEFTVDRATATSVYKELVKRGNAKHTLNLDRIGRRELVTVTLAAKSFIPESLFGVTRNKDNTWDHWLDRERRIAYMRLGPIEGDTPERLQTILHEMRDIRGLVLDVRWCPGGYIDSATQIASIFLESGIIARMNYRKPDRGDNATIRADGGLVRWKAGDYPMLVLINGETIGGGELIASALRDNGRAVLAGNRSFGKASIQWPLDLPGLPGYSFKLTGGTYTRSNGKNLQRQPDAKPSDDWGLRPDPGYEIAASADLGRKLKEMHLLYALRPGGSREAMDLDDPLADPQRERARKLMGKMIEK